MASLGPKKDGSPNTEYFNNAESLQGFESVRLWLQKNSKKVSLICASRIYNNNCSIFNSNF